MTTQTPSPAPQADRAERIRPTTRAAHAKLYAWFCREFRLSEDGRRLLRLRADRRKPPKVIEPTGKGTTREVMLGGVYALAHDVAHVLAVGPDGPVREDDQWRPVDGDWLNVHPSNWQVSPELAQPRGAAGRAAALRARQAARESGLARGGRVGEPMYHQRVTEDARYWWGQAAGAWGDATAELNIPWAAAAEGSPRYWALSHHLAAMARRKLAGPPPEGMPRGVWLDSVRLACLDERTTVMADATRWARVVAWAAAAWQRGDLHDSPEQAGRAFAAARTDAAAPASDDADLY